MTFLLYAVAGLFAVGLFLLGFCVLLDFLMDIFLPEEPSDD